MNATAQKKYRQELRRCSHFHNTPGLQGAEVPCILSSSGDGVAVAEGGVGVVGDYIVSDVMHVSLQEELQERANWAESAEQIRQEQMELQSCLKERPRGRILVTSDYLCGEVFWRSPGVLFVCPQGFSFSVAWAFRRIVWFRQQLATLNSAGTMPTKSDLLALCCRHTAGGFRKHWGYTKNNKHKQCSLSAFIFYLMIAFE